MPQSNIRKAASHIMVKATLFSKNCFVALMLVLGIMVFPYFVGFANAESSEDSLFTNPEMTNTQNLDFDENFAEAFSSVDDLKPNQDATHPVEDTFEKENPLLTDPETYYRAGVRDDKVIQPQFETCPKGQDACIKLSATMLSFVVSGYSLPGEPVEALIKKDIMWNKKVLIPQGSKLTGYVTESEVAEAIKDETTNSILAIQFEQLWLPNQKDAYSVNFKWRKEESKSVRLQHKIGDGLKGGLKGALQGAAKGLSLGGLYTAVNTYGATVIAPSAVGAFQGAAAQMRQTDYAIVLEEGEQLSFWLDPNGLKISSQKGGLVKPTTSTVLSAVTTTTASNTSQALINLVVTSVKLGADPFDEKNQLTVDFFVTNGLNKTLSALNVAIVDSFGKRYYLSPFADNKGYLVKFPALQNRQQQLTFSINNPQLEYSLVVYNPDQPNQVLAKASIPKL